MNIHDVLTLAALAIAAFASEPLHRCWKRYQVRRRMARIAKEVIAYEEARTDRPALVDPSTVQRRLGRQFSGGGGEAKGPSPDELVAEHIRIGTLIAEAQLLRSVVLHRAVADAAVQDGAAFMEAIDSWARHRNEPSRFIVMLKHQEPYDASASAIALRDADIARRILHPHKERSES